MVMDRRKIPWIAAIFFISAMVIGVVSLLLLIVVFPCQTRELASATSPDKLWVSTVSEKVCNATFSAPVRFVGLHPAGLLGFLFKNHVVFEFEIASNEQILKAKWVNPNNLEISVSQEAFDTALLRERAYDSVSIDYKEVLPSQ
jgi:hypothetical protein